MLKRFDRWRLVVRKGEADGSTVEVEALAGPSEPVSEPRNRTLKVSDGKSSSKVTRPFYEPKYSVVE